MRIHSILHGSRVNGPGLRSVIWTQGCALGCKGCWNRPTWDFNGGLIVDPTELAERIVRDAPEGTEGVTISGGEPMHQALSVYAFICMIRAIRPNWTIGMFTGFDGMELMCGTYDLREHLPLNTTEIRSLLWTDQIRKYLDWTVVGRFDATRPRTEQSDPMCSSANQYLSILTGRQTKADFPDLAVEITIKPDGLTQVTGFPVKGL